MINPEKRNAIYQLYKEGMTIRRIARTLKASRNQVRKIIEQKGQMPDQKRSDKIEIPHERLVKLHRDCSGYIRRMYEILNEEDGIRIGYATLCRLVHDAGLKEKKGRCGKVPDEPGREMQHDTSTFQVNLGVTKVRLIASVLYLRYSKAKYVKFYRRFNRFTMKCFLHEAFMFFKHAAIHCIIDNTNLARWYGSGEDAVMVPEMVAFARRYGFEFKCHRIKHSNRKAGNERSFFTIDTNFLPGRTFLDLEDLNHQAFDWATNRMMTRPQERSRLIPVELFEEEKSFLAKVSEHTPRPFLSHTRILDQYGYAAFNGNYYYVPGQGRGQVTLIEYADRIAIYKNREKLVEFELPKAGVRNESFNPKGSTGPSYRPKNLKYPTKDEEDALSKLSFIVKDYISFLKTKLGRGRHGTIRRLYTLHRKLIDEIFIEVIARAHKYEVYEIQAVENIATYTLRAMDIKIPVTSFDELYADRQTYIDGKHTDPACYDKFTDLIED